MENYIFSIAILLLAIGSCLLCGFGIIAVVEGDPILAFFRLSISINWTYLLILILQLKTTRLIFRFKIKW